MVGRITGSRGTTSTGSATPQPAAVKAATRQKLLKAFDKLSKAGTVKYGAHPPVGVRFVRVPLMTEKHPDGFSYTALIPVGALRPGVKPLDPNKAKDFVLERSGGIAGITQYAGPFPLSGKGKAADPFFSNFLDGSGRSGGGVAVTEKFPSDNEDGGSGRTGGGGRAGGITTEKFPSDNEDGGSGGRTSGGGRVGGGGGNVFTEKYPSDNDE